MKWISRIYKKKFITKECYLPNKDFFQVIASKMITALLTEKKLWYAAKIILNCDKKNESVSFLEFLYALGKTNVFILFIKSSV